jgi:23S rRNA (cytosine1962-C5)-methyltransferase
MGMVAFQTSCVSWPSWRVIATRPNWLVVNKPVGLPVHGGREDIDDVVTRVSAFLRERGEPDYLSVHSRLDQDVSGLLFFGRDRSENARLAEAMAEHRIHRGYRAIAVDGAIPEQFTLRDQLGPVSQGPTRIVQKGGVEAVTRGRVLRRAGGRALVELWPETGRRHQLRVQMSSRRWPILGDRLYGGPPAGRLMLHSAELVCEELDLHLDCPLPAAMELDRGPGTLPDPAELRELIFDAAWRRSSLARQHDTYRMVNGAGDELEGIVVDRYGDFAVVELFSEESLLRRAHIVEGVSQLGAEGVYVKCRPRRDLRRADPEVLTPTVPDVGRGVGDALVVREGGVAYAIEPGDGYDTGLYLDQRENRRRVRASANGQRILNLFGYTGSFSVVGALGGALSTTTVDLSERALSRARRNFGLNQIPQDAHRLVRAEVVDWLRRAEKRPERFDLVILDPPSFSTTGRSRVFRLEDAWDTLFERSLCLLSNSGQMLVVSHERPADRGRLRRRLRQALSRVGKQASSLVDLPSGVDCPESMNGPYPSFSLWLRLGGVAPSS